jgi:toxin YoeB
VKLVWHPSAWDEYVDWQAGDRRILKRINALIKDIQRGDDGGIGKPELLKGDLSGWASRRINEEHRLVYRVVDARGEREILSWMMLNACTMTPGRPTRAVSDGALGKGSPLACPAPCLTTAERPKMS